MSKFYTLVRRFCALAIGLSLTFAFSAAWAWPPTYGAEFEVSYPGLGGYDFKTKNPSLSPEKKQQMEMVEHMRERCLTSGCKVVAVQGKWDQDYRVEYEDGWWYKISYDPACVEITFKPSTLEVLEQKKELINDQIFKSASDVGLSVRKMDTSHFNMGIRSAFDDDGSQFLRFFVDYSNHPDLALGSLGQDINNAPPLSILGADQREALQQIIKDHAAGKLTTIAEIARAIQDRVYTASYRKAWGGITHYQAVGLKYVNKTDLTQRDAPMELRAVWIQSSAEQFNLVSKLIEGRIKYLKNLTTSITYSSLDRTDFSYDEQLTRFYIYVEEAGMKYEDFKSLTPWAVQNAKLSPFLNVNAPAESRATELGKYWDLVESSAYVQAKAVEILSLPEMANSAQGSKLLQKLRDQASDEVVVAVAPSPQAAPGFFKRVGNLFRNPKQAIAAPLFSTNKDIFQSLLNSIEANQQAGGKQIITCEGILL